MPNLRDLPVNLRLRVDERATEILRQHCGAGILTRVEAIRLAIAEIRDEEPADGRCVVCGTEPAFDGGVCRWEDCEKALG